MASYPSSVKSFTNPQGTDKLNDPPHALQHENENDEITAIETELGTDPAGSDTDVKTRLDGIDTTISSLATPIYFNAVDYGDNKTDVEIQAAIEAANTAGGGVVYCPGDWTLTDTLTIYDFIILQGDGREATKLIWAGVADGTMVDASTENPQDYGFSRINIDGDETAAGIGIQCGGSAGSRPDYIEFDKVSVQYCQVGIDFNTRLKDTTFFDCRIVYNEKGLEHMTQGLKFVSGIIGANTVCGVRMTNSTLIEGIGMYTSGNELDFDFTDVTTAVSIMSFTACFLEASLSGIIGGNPASVEVIDSLSFRDCGLSTHGSNTGYMFDMTNLNVKHFNIQGGRLEPTAGTKAIHIPVSTTYLKIYEILRADNFVITGAGTCELNGLVQRRISYDGGATQVLFTTPDNCVIEKAWVFCTQTWDGTKTIDIGDSGNNSGLLATAKIGKTAGNYSGSNHDDYGAYLWDDTNDHKIDRFYGTPTAINAYVTSDGTQGTARVYIKIKDLRINE